MEELYVDQLMSRPVETVTPDTPVREAAAELVRHDVGALVVVDERGRLEGILTATDFVLLVRDGTATADATVGEFARTDVITTTRTAPVSDVAETMLDRRIHHVPVVDGEEVVGMVTSVDLAARLARSA
jgi:CBS domain-containing protein